MTKNEEIGYFPIEQKRKRTTVTLEPGVIDFLNRFQGTVGFTSRSAAINTIIHDYEFLLKRKRMVIYSPRRNLEIAAGI
jgi:hypothetical protein